MNNTSLELANVIEKMVKEQVSEHMKILEDTYFAKSKQTIFTTSELCDRWGCSKVTVATILKHGNVKPISKRGKEHEYNIEQAEQAKRSYDKNVLHQHELSVKVRAM
ncbi:hypothetical protein IGI37_000060 [Enterococcus sp. AZ194]|uniref:MarR family transcriptional regulator n=1 Tax=Enterococcus sp. AZ194 TaxID=2774629 RepID=UPI003F270CA1